MTKSRIHAAARKSTGWLVILAVIFGLLWPGAAAAESTRNTYANPISSDFADAFPDPSIIRAKDGYWYSYATTTVMRKDNPDSGHRANYFMPISRSKDLIHWEYVGDVFSYDNHPEWTKFDGGTYFWAPDVRYINGEYYLYYSVVNYSFVGFDRYQIGLATAPTPAGPWTDIGRPLVESSTGTLTIDPAHFIDSDGTRYLYYGSFNDNGILVVQLSEDGKETVGEPKQVVKGHTGEAPYVVKRGNYYYLFYSDKGCCSNTLSSYTVYVGRSESPMGPFFDREGNALTDVQVGGTIVNAPNGNRWIGTGHNAIVTDLSGQDWMVFNGINKDDPEFSGYRPMMMDRLDWIYGWPVLRAGHWTSEDEQPAPITEWLAGSDFNDAAPLDAKWLRDGAARGGWRLVQETEGQSFVRQQAPARQTAFLITKQKVPKNVRVVADLRLPEQSGRAGLVAAYFDSNNYLAAWLDADEQALVTEVVIDGAQIERSLTPLHDGFRYEIWHHVAIEIRDGLYEVQVTEAEQGDPLAVHSGQLPDSLILSGQIGIASRSSRAEADNVGAAELYEPVTKLKPDPDIGSLDPSFSDEFDSEKLADEWFWVRTPKGELKDGAYRFPSQNSGWLSHGTVSVLLRDAPDGDYTMETKMHFPLGTEGNKNFHQAGLIAYVDDLHSIRIISMGYHDTRQVKFVKEINNSNGTMRIGSVSDTIWLRIKHTIDPVNGEREFQGAISTDGQHWIWGGVWTLPADAEHQIGLVSMGGEGTDAEFEYFRVYR